MSAPKPPSGGTPSFVTRALFRKPIEAIPEMGLANASERTMSARSLVALGLGGLIGSGIFVIVGVAAHDKAGPAVILSFFVAAIACIFVALCYCECASVLPVAGSAYAYAYATIGELGAWIVGWNLATCYFLAGAAVSQGWSGYFQNLLGALGGSIPKVFSGVPFDVNPATGSFVGTGAFFDLPALLMLGVITFVVYRGIRISLRVNQLLLALKLTVLALIVVVGLAHAHIINWTPFAPFGYGGVSLKSILGGILGDAPASAGMLAGATTVFFAFGGFEMLSVYSHECRNPRRDVPVGIIATIGLLTLIYIAVALALTGMVPYHQISVSAPLSDAFRIIGLPWMQGVIAFGAIAGLTSVLLVVVMSLPRVLMAIGEDGLIPHSFFSAMHPTYRTPFKGVLFAGIGAMVAGSFLPLRFIMDAVMMATLAGYIAVCVFVLILRRRPLPQEPVFRVPLGITIPVLGILVCLMFMLSLPPINWIRLLVWWTLGFLFYLGYGRSHGRLSPAK